MSYLPLPSPMLFVILPFALWNAGVMLLFGLDKRAAVYGLRRVPERRLIVAVLLFGAMGGWLGQRLFRHKTRKPPFTWLIPLMTGIQVACLVVLLGAIAVQNSWP